MNFKMKPIKSKPFLLINYIDNNEEMFVDKKKYLLSSEATDIQKEILKCYNDDDYFEKLPEVKKNEIYDELIKFSTK